MPTKLAHEIPDSQLVELPGVDHDPWVRDNEQAFAAVEAFVAGLGRLYGVAAGKLTRHNSFSKVVWVPSR